MSTFSFKLFALVLGLGWTVSGYADAKAPRCPYKLVTYKNTDKKTQYGLATQPQENVPSAVIDVTAELRQTRVFGRYHALSREAFFSTELNAKLAALQCEIEANPAAFAERKVELKPEQIAPAIPEPVNVVALGLNHKAHAAEVGKDGADGFIFSKNVPLTGAYANIVRPAYSLLDYEVEIGVVVRKEIHPGERITPENMHEYIAGFVLANDVSNRVPILLDKGDGSFTAAKTYPTFLPVGPYFVPIENFAGKIEGGKFLPKLKMSTVVVRAQDAARGDFTKAEVRQEGYSDENDFFITLGQAIETALKQRNLEDVAADGQPQMLLKRGHFEAGDLVLMGTLAGVALRLKGFSEGFGIIREGVRNRKADTMAIFWPHYRHLYAEDSWFSSYNFGGPPPMKWMENWMQAKSWIVGREYCNSQRLYLEPGEVVVMGIEELGTQRNTIVQSATPAGDEEARRREDAGAMRHLCETHGQRSVWSWAKIGAPAAAAVVGDVAIWKKVRCSGRICKILKGLGLVAVSSAGLQQAADIWIGGQPAPSLEDLRNSPLHQRLTDYLGAAVADNIIMDLIGGVDVDESIQARVVNAGQRVEAKLLVESLRRSLPE